MKDKEPNYRTDYNILKSVINNQLQEGTRQEMLVKARAKALETLGLKNISEINEKHLTNSNSVL